MSILAAIQSAGPMNIPNMMAPPPRQMPIIPGHAMPVNSMPAAPPPPVESAPKRITMWNKRENRKISGNAAPMEKNIEEYLRKHPECEVYNGQRSQLDPAIRAAQLAAEPRITIWNKSERRKVSGNAAPLEKNITEYLRKHPDCEVYDGQDKRPTPYPMQFHPSMHHMAPPMMLSNGIVQYGAKPMPGFPGPMPVAKQQPVDQSPKCTLDFLAMVACQENLNLNNAEDYQTDGEEEEQQGAPTEGKHVRVAQPTLGKRSLECSAIDQLCKRVKSSAA